MLRKLEPIDTSVAVGDVVYSLLYGKGVVKIIGNSYSNALDQYPICVEFTSGITARFSKKGVYINGQIPSLFKYPIDMIDDFASAIHIEYYTED